MRRHADGIGPGIARTLATARLEARLNLLTPAPWVVGAIMAAFAYLTVRTAPDPTSFSLAWGLSAELGPLSALLLLVLAASFAHRPQRYEVTELLDSKVVASEELVFGGWLAMVVAVTVPLLLQYGVAILAQKIHTRMEISFAAYGLSLLRVLPPVLFLSTLAYGLVRLLRILVLGSGLAGLAWFVVYAGEQYFPSSLWLRLSQNGTVFLGLTAATLLLLLTSSQARRRRKRAPVTYVLSGLTGLAALTVCVYAAWLALAVPGSASAAATWRRLNSGKRNPKQDPLPNLAWVDQHGRRVSLAAYRGKVLLLLVFQPRDGALLTTLRRLDQVRSRLPQDQFGVLGICLSEDLNGARHAGLLAGVGFPLVTDWGAPVPGEFDPHHPGSAASWALQVKSTPAAILVDRNGRELTRSVPLDDDENLRARLEAAIQGEELGPEPAAGGELPAL